MLKLLFDTCSMLNLQEEMFDIKDVEIFISSVSLVELENIKSNGRDEDLKYSARRLLHLLDEREDQFTVVIYRSSWDMEIMEHKYLVNEDSRIIITALNNGLTLVTDDLACKTLARAVGVPVHPLPKKEEIYTGFKEVKLNDEELAEFYNEVVPNKDNKYNLDINQYLIIRDDINNPIDSYCWTNEYTRLNYQKIESRMFGKLKPKDIYQQLAIHSLKQNSVTMLSGYPGSGKSLIALSYLYSLLEKGELDKLVIFCNPVIARGAAKLGFYPGSRSDKVLDSSIGGILETKFGDRIIIDSMLENGTLMLVPAGDARGLDLTGFKAGVWIVEAQNLDKNLMKIFLQRLGEDCKCVIDGDFQNQTDSELYSGNKNGMKRVLEVFKGKPFFGAINLQNIYRSKIAKIAERL